VLVSRNSHVRVYNGTIVDHAAASNVSHVLLAIFSVTTRATDNPAQSEGFYTRAHD